MRSFTHPIIVHENFIPDHIAGKKSGNVKNLHQRGMSCMNGRKKKTWSKFLLKKKKGLEKTGMNSKQTLKPFTTKCFSGSSKNLLS